MMVDLKLLLITLVGLLIVWGLDRFILKRGAINLIDCSIYDKQEGYWRFALSYELLNAVYWGEIRYQLRDKSNPSTVITGRSRTLDHASSGYNHEFLHIKEILTATSDTSDCWELIIVVNTVVGHWNPLYKYFPLTHKQAFEVVLDGK